MALFLFARNDLNWVELELMMKFLKKQKSLHLGCIFNCIEVQLNFFLGDRRDSNPRMLEPQSRVLTNFTTTAISCNEYHFSSFVMICKDKNNQISSIYKHSIVLVVLNSKYRVVFSQTILYLEKLTGV